jgi:hypothetical protein
VWARCSSSFTRPEFWENQILEKTAAKKKIFRHLLSQSVFAAAGSSKMGEEEKDMREYANTAGIGICA